MGDISWLDKLSLDVISSSLNSQFASSLIGALAGAFAGAWAAKKIADRGKLQEQLLAQIRNTNAAIIVSFSICNTALALKSQYTKKMYDEFMSKRAELSDLREKQKNSTAAQGAEFELRADFRRLQMPYVPIDILRTQVYEKLSVSGRPLALIATIEGALSSLDDTITKRNTLIEHFKTMPQDSKDIVNLYFGFQLDNGHRSTEYFDTVEAINRLIDDVIFFSELLSRDLEKHGNASLKAYQTRFKGVCEKIQSADLSKARQAGLMPDEKEYESWLSAFKETKPGSSA